MRGRARRAQHSAVPGWSGKTLDKVDSRSTAQADSFAGAKEGKKRRLAPLGMTVGCFDVLTVDGAGMGMTGRDLKAAVGWALTGSTEKRVNCASCVTNCVHRVVIAS
jgi:hypothetical protein